MISKGILGRNGLSWLAIAGSRTNQFYATDLFLDRIVSEGWGADRFRSNLVGIHRGTGSYSKEGRLRLQSRKAQAPRVALIAVSHVDNKNFNFDSAEERFTLLKTVVARSRTDWFSITIAPVALYRPPMQAAMTRHP